MNDPFVSVIVCVYNRASEVHKCLDALLEQTYFNYEILVVDDYSEDDLEGALAKYPDLHYVKNTLEFSLPAARNMGIEESKGDILIFLDDDAIVERDYIEKIVGVFKDNPAVGGATGRLKSVIVQDIKKGPLGALMSTYVKLFGISGFFANQEGIGQVLDSGFITSNFEQHTELTTVQWISGCNQCYSREAIEKAGGFDSGYVGHAYYEDADMSYRVYKAGFDLYAVPDAVVDHQVTPVSREKLSRVKYFQLIHVNRFFLKNVYQGSKIRYLKHLVAHLALSFPVLGYSIIGRDPGLLANYIKAELVVLKRIFTGID